jgi:small-conductance mechanosensitive channel
MITVGAFLVLWVCQKIVLKLVWRKVEDVHARYYWRKMSTYVSTGALILILGFVWFKDFQVLFTFLGLLSAGLAIALKDIVVNLAGWVFIIWNQPLQVGDRIEIGEHKGDVVDIRLFRFTLIEIGNWVSADQSTGRIIHVPNGQVLNHAIANYSRGFRFIWNELPILVTFESNWKKAKQILQEIVNEHSSHLDERAKKGVKEASRKFLIFYSKLTPIVYTSVQDCGVLLTVRYLTEPRSRRNTESQLWESVLEEFSKHDDIDFAYPTLRTFMNPLESKHVKSEFSGLSKDIFQSYNE